jgi:hypothetical protein
MEVLAVLRTLPAGFSLLRRLRTPIAVERVFCNGSMGSAAIGFTVVLTNTEMRPLVGVSFTAEIEDVQTVAEETFSMEAGEVGRRIRFGVARPRLGDLVPEFGGEHTLYGRRLTITIRAGWLPVRAVHREEVYDATTNGARYVIQQQIWASARRQPTSM